MRTFIKRSTFDVPAAELFAWHERPGAIHRLVPGWSGVRIIQETPQVHSGGEAVVRVPFGPFGFRWVSVHQEYVAGRQFVDVQKSGPMSSWRHTHRVSDAGPGQSVLEDEIQFRAPMWDLPGAMVLRDLEKMFTWRHARTAADLAFHKRFSSSGPRRILISGASGLIGTALSALLTTGGHTVIRLVRNAAQAGPLARVWNPYADRLDPSLVEGVDAVIHLAGENVGAGRWNEARKRRIRESRVIITQNLSRAIAEARKAGGGPQAMITASAVGIYGDRGAEELNESAAPAEGFLPQVAVEWEGATRQAAESGARVAMMRLGVVLAAEGGALAKMLTPFKLGLGGRIGSGAQYWSWITLDDAAGAFAMAALDENVQGPVNVVSGAVSNLQFTKTLGRVLRRPTIFPVPAQMIKLLLGEMADALLLAGANVVPARLRELNYPFRHTELESALRWLLGR